MAQQLHAQGQQVAFLALFDAFLGRVRQKQKGYSLHHHWLNLLELGPDYLHQKIQKRWKRSLRLARLKILGKQLGEKLSQRTGNYLQNLARYTRFEEAYRSAVADYTPQVYPGHLTFFLASEWRFLKKYSAFVHQLATDGVDVYEIPGYHDSLFDSPQVEILGEQLKKCLEKAQGVHMRETQQDCY